MAGSAAKLRRVGKLNALIGGNQKDADIDHGDDQEGDGGWNGDVYADQFWRNFTLGNVKEKTFKRIWDNKDGSVLQHLRNKDKFADKRCLRCKWFSLCKGNFRFLGSDPADENWLNEPACSLTDEEIILSFMVRL